MTRTSAFLTGLAAGYLFFLAMMLALLIAFPADAKAFDDFHWSNAPPEYRKAVRKRHRAPRVKGWVKQEPWPVHDDRKHDLIPPQPLCMSPILAAGEQGISERGAEEKARDAWGAKVRSMYGERMMDLRFASGFQKRCYRSSVGDNPLKSMRDKIGERIGIVDDRADSNDAMEYRCEIWAAPCEPTWQAKGDDVKNAGGVTQ